MDENLIPKSRFLSRVLRHRPDSIGIELDAQGWVGVQELLQKAAGNGMEISLDELERIVAENDKSRFAFSPDGTKLRAVQGHSVNIDLGLTPKTPPPVLYHGTVGKFLAAIRKEGLRPGTRQHVHLSETKELALSVGARRGKPVILVVETYPLLKEGAKFWQAENGVWLSEAIPARFIRFQ